MKIKFLILRFPRMPQCLTRLRRVLIIWAATNWRRPHSLALNINSDFSFLDSNVQKWPKQQRQD